jgi:hypothetical protein
MKKLAALLSATVLLTLNLNAQCFHRDRITDPKDYKEIISEIYGEKGIIQREFISKKYNDIVKFSLVWEYKFEDNERERLIHYIDQFTELNGSYVYKEDCNFVLNNGNTVYYRTYVMNFTPHVPILRVLLISMDKNFESFHKIIFEKEDGYTLSEVDEYYK